MSDFPERLPAPPQPAAARDGATRLFRHARREAVIVGVVWALSLLWTVGYCYVHGYGHDADSWLARSGLVAERPVGDFHAVLGLPEWLLYGILAPWLACTLFTLIFAGRLMTDDDLGREADEGGGHGH